MRLLRAQFRLANGLETPQITSHGGETLRVQHLQQEVHEKVLAHQSHQEAAPAGDLPRG